MTHRHRPSTARTSRAVASLAAAALLGLAGCSAGDDHASSGGSASGGQAEQPVAGSVPARDGFAVADGVDVASSGEDEAAPVAAEQQRALVHTGTVELRSDDVGEARFDVRAVVDRHAGEVVEDTTDTDEDGEAKRSRMVVRVPADDFDEAVQELTGVADLVRSDTRTVDVTDQVIDTNVRLQVQQRSIRRIAVLLDRASSIRDIVAIEAQLSRRQADLDSLRRRAAHLASTTEMSTITVTLRRTAEKEAEDDDTGFVAGLAAGWGALGAFAVGAATVLGALLPWAVVTGVLAAVLWPLVRRLRRRPAAPTTPAGA